MADKIEIEVGVKDQTARQKIKEFNKEISALDKQIKKLGTNRVDEFFGDLSAQLSTSENKLPQLKGALSGVNTQLAEMIKQYPDMKTMAAVAEKSAAFPEHIQSRLKGYGIPQEALDSYNQLLQKQAELKSAIGGTQNEIKNYKSMLADAGSTTTGSDNFDKQKAALEQLVQELRDYLQGMSDMSQVSNEYIVNAVAGISRLKTEMEDLKTVGKTFGTNIYDEDFQNLYALEQELKHYKAELIKEAPLPKYLQEYVNKSTVANNKISKLSTELKELKQQQKEMEQAGLGLGTKEYDETLVKIKNIENELKAYKKSLLDAQEVKPNTAAWDNFKNTLKNINKAISSVAKRMLSVFTSPFKKMNKHLDGFNKRLKTAILQGLIFRQVRSVLQKMVQSMYELAIANKDVSTSFAQVKGATITAFQPILTALIPIIQKVCNWLVILIQYISELLNLLGLVGKASKSTAKAMSQQASATGSASKANDKFLASWDTIQQVQQKSSGGGGGGSEVTPDFDYAEADLSVLDALKNKISIGDWYGIGMEISAALNNVLTDLNTWLKTKFTPAMDAFSNNAADLLNGLFDGFDPVKLSTAVSTGLITALNSVSNFLNKVNWDSLGRNIADFIINLDWDNLLSALSGVISSAIGAALELIGGLFGLDSGNLKNATKAIDNFKSSLTKLAIAVKNKLKDAYYNVLVPLAKWTFDVALPALINVLADAFSFLADIISKIDIATITGIVVAILSFKAIIGIPEMIAGFVISLGELSLKFSTLISLTNPILAVVAAVVALTVGVIAWNAVSWNNNESKIAADNISAIATSITDESNAIIEGSESRQTYSNDLVTQAEYSQTLVDRLYSLADQSIKTSSDLGEMQGIVDTLNNLYPDLNLQLDTVNGTLNKTKGSVDEYVASLLEQYKTEALKENIIQAYKDQAEAVKNQADAENNAIDAHKKVIEKQNELTDAINVTKDGVVEWNGGIDDLKLELGELQAAEKDADDAVTKSKEAYDKINDEIDIYSGLLGDNIKNYQDTDKAVSDMNDTTSSYVKTVSTELPKANTAMSTMADTAKTKTDGVKTAFDSTSKSVGTSTDNMATSTKTAETNIGSSLDTTVKDVTAFNTDVSKALSETNSTLSSSWSAINATVKTQLNTMLTNMANWANRAIDAINAVINAWAILDASSDTPSMKSYTTANHISIPALAQGTVVNPGHQFAAILGDNRVEQEVVSPLSTMKEAFIEALQQSGYNRGGKIVMEMDGKVFAKVANPYFEKENSRIGIKAVGGI